MSFQDGCLLAKMTVDFATKYIWACDLRLNYSFTGKKFLFKIIKTNLTNLRRKKLPEKN